MTSQTPFEDDLHDLMAAAVLAGRYGVEVDVSPIYAAWEAYYPEDALGPVGRGLKLVVDGKTEDGLAIIQQAAESAATRADQAGDVLKSLINDLLGEEETA